MSAVGGKPISIMVLPTGPTEALPQFLMEMDGIWRDMSPPPQVRAQFSVTVIKSEINALLDEMASQMRRDVAPSRVPLVATLRQRYQDIIPAGIHDALQRALAAPGATPTLRIHMHTATEWIPWEILHDGTDFLGLRLPLARLPIMPTGPNLGAQQPRQVQRVYNLLGENTFDTPVAAALSSSWQATFDGLLPAAVQQVRLPGANGQANAYPNVDQFMMAAAQSDILHVTCHGDYDPADGRVFWTLNRFGQPGLNYRIRALFLNTLNLAHAPLIFGNACYSGRGGDTSNSLAPGFGAIFFEKGALAFIGTLAAITQPVAVSFARQFYQRLLGAPGMPVGQALWETKRYFAAQNSLDPSYLYYTLYGPAETRFVL